MKFIRKSLLVCLITLLIVLCSCQNINGYRGNIYDDYFINNSYISNFPHGNNFAVSLIFDDNDNAHFEKVYPILKSTGLNATFNVSPGYENFKSVYLDGYMNLQNIGCEIGAHGWYHTDMTSLSPSELELHMCKKPIQLISQYFGKTPISISLNNAQVNDDVITLFNKYYYVSKHVSLVNVEREKLPMIPSTTYDDFLNSVNAAKNKEKWLMIAMHGIDGSGWAGGSITSELFSQICVYLSENDILVDTSGKIGLYEYLYENVELKIYNISNQYYEIIPVYKNNIRWPESYSKIITVCIPMVNGDLEMIDFDLQKNKRIVISHKGVSLQ